MSGGKGILTGMFWMIFLSILLFWLPVIGPLVAGFVGGKKSGGVMNAIIASILPALIIGGLFFIAGSFVGLPFISALIGGSVALIAFTDFGLVFIGAIIGGAFS